MHGNNISAGGRRVLVPQLVILSAGLLMLGAALTSGGASQTPQQGKREDTWAGQQQSQAVFTQRLAASPLRNGWITIPYRGRQLHAWVIYPARTGKVPVVLVLHEVFGLTDSTRNSAREIAEMGYIAITPDMLSGYGPNLGDVRSFADSRLTSDTLTGLPDATVNGEIDAWADYASRLSSSSHSFAIAGLSWGGGAAFRYAATTAREDLKLVCVFYDVGPPAITQGADRNKGLTAFSVTRIGVPVAGFYGANDTRVMNSLEATETAMAAAHKDYQPVIYAGADHAFMRMGEMPDAAEANGRAAKESLERLRGLFTQYLR